jgi:ATP-binding cassette subfamily B protein
VSTLSQISGVVSVDQHTTFLDDYFSFLSVDPLVRCRACAAVPASLATGIGTQRGVHYPGGTTRRGRSQPASGRRGIAWGENGAGKARIQAAAAVLRRRPGAVRVGGADVRSWISRLRNRIGVLFQDYASYELSVRDNVVMGRPDGIVDDGRVMEALRDSRSEWLVNRMPKGLDSKVGRLFEGGHDLSGGEWQRLALARIMYRDADIWILDEPTSSLDPEAEAGIFAELKENLKGRIGIVISHRFSTVRIADRIAVIADGRVTELGTHAELLRAGGRYSQLFELQAAGYR